MPATYKHKVIGLLSLLATIVVLYELSYTWEIHPKELIYTNTLSATNAPSLRGVSTNETTRQLLEYGTLHNAGDREVLRNGSIKGSERRLAQNDEQSLDEDGRYICVNESEVYKELVKLANEKRLPTKHENVILKPTFVGEEAEQSWAKEIHFKREDRLRERGVQETVRNAVPGHVFSGLNHDSMKLQPSENGPKQMQKEVFVTPKRIDPRMDVFTKTSLDPNIVARGKFQQLRMEMFCKYYNSTLPNALENLSKLFHHLLYDDSKKIVFCYVPENGCSNMQRLLLILNGVLPPESANMTIPPEDELKQIKSFESLTDEQAIYRLKTYYKVVIVRNPMERLLSAYRDKIEPPFVFADRLAFPDRVKFLILQLYRKTELKSWYFSRNRTKISPTFSEFVRFMTLYPLSYYNEHFKPVLELCHPCAVQYDFYPNFKTLDYDLYAMLRYLDIPSEYYPQVFAHSSTPTEIYLDDFFSEVPHSEKQKLFEVFSDELNFYYSLYPEESNMHSKL